MRHYFNKILLGLACALALACMWLLDTLQPIIDALRDEIAR